MFRYYFYIFSYENYSENQKMTFLKYQLELISYIKNLFTRKFLLNFIYPKIKTYCITNKYIHIANAQIL